MSLSTLTLKLGNLHFLANEHTSETSNMIGCFSPISSITAFLASLKHPSSTLDADVSIKSSSSSSASVVSSDSCYILDCRLRHKLEKKPWICRLDNRSVPSNILSPSTVQAVRLSFATCSRSCLLPVSRPILNFCVKYCLTFCESHTLAPLLWRAHPMGSCEALVKGSVATATSSV